MNTITVPLERHVRSRDPETSWNAAAIDPESWSELQTNIVTILRDVGPLIDEELHKEYKRRGMPRRSASRIRTARAELELTGVVADSGQTGLTESDKPAIKWEVVSR